MAQRRILSLWFPRLGAERLLRRAAPDHGPFAVVEDRGNAQVLCSLSAEADQAGLREGQPLRDALAMCPDLTTRLRNPQAELDFLRVLRRWAGKFSPWVADQPPASLLVDLTGCAHLFGGEEALLAQAEEDCAAMGLTVHAGIGDSPGAAWALARFAGQPERPGRSGDAIDQEAPATRARAVKRRNWERGGPPPRLAAPGARAARIAAPGQARQALAGLPVAALRLDPEVTASLVRLGLRRIGDLAGMPRAALARRFGAELGLRLDQALGVAPEPISPARAPLHFAVRMSFPDPIGTDADILAGIDRLLARLSERLVAAGRGARRLRLQAYRADQSMQWVEVGLARPSAEADRIRPLLVQKLGDIDPGFGIDCLRIEAHVTEPVKARQHRGHLDAAASATARQGADTALDDLIGKLGARIGLEAILRLHPADSHIPEKAVKVLPAAWSEPATDWPRPPAPRPLVLWRPEPVQAEDRPTLPLTFRWRRRTLRTLRARGPERIAPEWWLDEPDWRSGVRDYWRVTVTGAETGMAGDAAGGETLWLYYAHGAAMSSGWFCQGSFA
ncbi:Y-family DNA polymerase [Frigidibacter sp. ROC022]|uniref:Y-family DNA polymerase n=1 Tax=Frigidibacter sp. ROC022 TaxID=2971796 RepID=UPI00215A0F64|nr:DNA polymerase Y family protein [Frigidibacter sp. ROC022]MCR8724224.1 DNA polymerase Y family protein [Frigidibacter sp. ROC022]